jgi:1-deoxy-D-xylulose-5-phosphate reductoisomerase
MALKHPTWSMGDRMTIDSATLMNKGFEVLEARWLFDLPVEKISVLVHPQSIVHSMVEYVDGSVIAQLGVTDMRHPIQYALTFPERVSTPLHPLDFTQIQKLEFLEPEFKKFPCLELAYQAARKLGSYPCVLNAADEIAVEAFLMGKIGFNAIGEIVDRMMQTHGQIVGCSTVAEIVGFDAAVRRETRQLIEKDYAR